MPRLPLAPPLIPDEALSSWVARIAARYDFCADTLVRHLLPNAADATEMVRRLDYGTVAPLEAALIEAAGQPPAGFAGDWLTGPVTRPQAAWPRTNPAWSLRSHSTRYRERNLGELRPICVARDVANLGEVYSRTEWVLGSVLLCPRHRCLLISKCPRCFHRAGYHPMQGRLRIWCWNCEAGADTALKPDRIPFWPYGTPQQRRSCVTVSLSSEARPLLRRVQTDSLATLAGAAPRGPWARSLKWARVFEVLRKLVFVMLGPLWEDPHQVAQTQMATNGQFSLSETWTAGSLPPEIAAPALLAAVTFLAAESGTQLSGITWNSGLLSTGEGDAITAATLLRHLNGFNARLAQDLFVAPFVRPFSLLLTALRADCHGLGGAGPRFRRRSRWNGKRRGGS